MREDTLLFKALADANRLRILKMLEIRDLCVCEITEILGLAPSTVSKHLSILRNADLIWDRKDGKWVDYGLNKTSTNPLVTDILLLIKDKVTIDPVFREDKKKLLSTDRKTICGIIN